MDQLDIEIKYKILINANLMNLPLTSHMRFNKSALKFDESALKFDESALKFNESALNFYKFFFIKSSKKFQFCTY